MARRKTTEANRPLEDALRLARAAVESYGHLIENDTFTPKMYQNVHAARLARLSAYRVSLTRQIDRAGSAVDAQSIAGIPRD